MSKRIIFSAVFFSLFFFIILFQINCASNEKKEMTHEEMVIRGEYLVTVGGCNDCHSPKIFTEMGPMPDTTKLLSGYPADAMLAPIDTNEITPGKWYLASADLTAWVGPWGISYAANLTPDEPTGLGNWTDEIFIKAMRTGKHMGTGRPILPPMPWFNYAKATDEDLKAILAYLKSLPPINNRVPDPVPPNMISSISNKTKGMKPM